MVKKARLLKSPNSFIVSNSATVSKTDKVVNGDDDSTKNDGDIDYGAAASADNCL